MSAEKKPVVAITIGDPAGIGPEITVATMMDKSVYDECKPFLIGSVPIISRAMKIMGCDFAIHKIAHPQEARFSWGTLDVLETGDYDCDSIEWGKVQKLAGQMSLDYVMKSIELGKAGLIEWSLLHQFIRKPSSWQDVSSRAIPKSIRWKPNLITV